MLRRFYPYIIKLVYYFSSSVKEQKDMVDKVKAPFEGDYICERAETFITYHDGIKDPQIFLVLKSK